MGRAVRTRATVQATPRSGAAHWHALQGDLRHVPLGWLLQVMGCDSRTAVHVVRRGEEEGTICIERGDPIHAEPRSATGIDAVRQMLAWEQGSFLVHPDPRTTDRTVDCTLMHLLIEEAVTEDHSNQIFGAVARGRRGAYERGHRDPLSEPPFRSLRVKHHGIRAKRT